MYNVVTMTSNAPEVESGIHTQNCMSFCGAKSFKIIQSPVKCQQSHCLGSSSHNMNKMILSASAFTLFAHCHHCKQRIFFSFQWMARNSQQCATWCLLLAVDYVAMILHQKLEARPPDEEDTSQIANFGIRSCATFFNFWRVLGIVRRKFSLCLEFPCGRSSTGCSSSSKVYCTNEWVSVSPSPSACEVKGNRNYFAYEHILILLHIILG